MRIEKWVKIDLLTRRTVTIESEETVEELHFFYDAQSRPAMVEYGGQLYSYLHNLQGDIIGIVDAAGNLVVEYRYDAWGKPIYEAGSLLSTLGTLNPFRYRGYVWDEETELYYLRSRYYSCAQNRFLNGDRVLSGNQFYYCNNNPVKNTDVEGLESMPAISQPAVDITVYIFTGKQYGHYVVGTMGIAYSWGSPSSGGLLTTYSENDVHTHMEENGYNEDYYKLIINVPYEVALAAVKRTFEVCNVKFAPKTLLSSPEKYVGHAKKMYHSNGERVKYDINLFSCFAFVDWFCQKGNIYLEKLIGEISSKDEEERIQYYFADKFLGQYASSLSTEGRFIYIPGKMRVFISNKDMQARRPR